MAGIEPSSGASAILEARAGVEGGIGVEAHSLSSEVDPDVTVVIVHSESLTNTSLAPGNRRGRLRREHNIRSPSTKSNERKEKRMGLRK